MTKKPVRIALLVAMLLCMTAAMAVAAVPRTITYQGYLKRSDETPVNGLITMDFALYTTASGGKSLWDERQVITVANGVYSVVLGGATPITLSFDADYYLGVAVEGEAEMTRIPLTSTGYAFMAENANAAATSTTATNFTGTLNGDVSGTQAATVVNAVGGQSAASVALGTAAANNATALNTANRIVMRDASGNFSAGTITANLAGNATTAASAVNFSGSLAGDVSGSQGATVVSTVGGQAAATVASSVTQISDATSSNMPATLVKRDLSGNFSAGTISANRINSLGSPITYLDVGSSVSVVTSGMPRFSVSPVGTVTINSLSGTPGIIHNDVSGNLSSSLVVNADISPSAGIADAKLATISTAGKVSNSATTATSSNIFGTIVARDPSGNFSAGTITATAISGSGESITGLNAGNLGSGTVPDARFPATLPAVSGANLMALNASNLASGTVPVARMPGLSGDVISSTGSTSTTVSGIRGVSVASTAPASGQVLTYNGSQWTPASASSSVSPEIVTGAPVSGGTYIATATCSGVKKVTGGGCFTNDPDNDYLIISYPSAADTWTCRYNWGNGTRTAFAVCM